VEEQKLISLDSSGLLLDSCHPKVSWFGDQTIVQGVPLF